MKKESVLAKVNELETAYQEKAQETQQNYKEKYVNSSLELRLLKESEGIFKCFALLNLYRRGFCFVTTNELIIYERFI